MQHSNCYSDVKDIDHSIMALLHERISMKNFYPQLSFFEYSYNFYTQKYVKNVFFKK